MMEKCISIWIKISGKYTGKVYLVYGSGGHRGRRLTVKNGEAREIYNVDTET